MATFQKCPQSVNDFANRVMNKFGRHKPLIDAMVKIDYVFAFPVTDDLGNVLSPALKLQGVTALGICRKLSLKDRAMGRGDAEISIDGNWWGNASDEERAALLDHELYHIIPATDKKKTGTVFKTDDMNRPVLEMRPHDFEVGWFHCVANDHGMNAIERKQAQQLMDEAGQYYWPELAFVIETSRKAGRMSKLELNQVAA